MEHVPTKVYFSRNVLEENAQEIVQYGKNALIVTGKTSAIKSGALDDLLPILEKHKVNYAIFNEITANPDIHQIQKGNDIFKENNCDHVIAIGGGSPMDAGKAISIMAANGISITDIYDTSLHKVAYPILAIPTTAGTGSEVTQYSVLNNNETKTKAGFGSQIMFPKCAFYNPKYTLSLDYTVTRDTAIDALSHLLEGLYSNKYELRLSSFIAAGFVHIYRTLLFCLDHLDDLRAREELLRGAFNGGVVIANSGTTMQHSIGYPLTTEFGLSHGLANGVVMKDVMNLFEPYIKDRFDNLFNYVGITKQDFFDWLDKLNMKFDGLIDDAFLEKRVPEVLSSRNMALNPCKVEEKDIVNIYKNIRKNNAN